MQREGKGGTALELAGGDATYPPLTTAARLLRLSMLLSLSLASAAALPSLLVPTPTSHSLIPCGAKCVLHFSCVCFLRL